MPRRASGIDAYKQHYLGMGDDRTDLFRKLAARYDVRRALYPGSWIDISPSLSIPHVVYVDSFSGSRRFFADPSVKSYVDANREYQDEASVTFHFRDYTGDLEETLESFDLLISLYAGFISTPCKRYLRPGGILVANDSHGDASMAWLDADLEFIAVVNRRGGTFSMSDAGLERYFLPKREIAVTPDYVRELGKGVPYTKWASAYLFQRVR